MIETPLSSSMIRTAGYEPELSELYITFNNGARWKYEGVPEEVFDSLVSSSSAGSFFANNIKYAYTSREI